jgi:hypothetical protein
MKKCDELLKKAEVFEKLALYGDRKSFLNAIAQNYTPPREDSNVPWEGGSSQGPAATPTQTLKETVITANPPIDSKVQKMLNDLLIPTGDIFPPLKLDGEMGPKTKEALQKFKARFGGNGTPQAVAQYYNQQNQSTVNLDDAAKKREEYYKSQSIPPGMPGSRA